MLPILLFALAGVLVGGVVAMRRQHAPLAVVAALGLLALLAAAAGLLRLVYG